ncbi:MAG: glycosyltransferase [Chloroflexi bacterium]|nr:glycosyltransferase [Chloroflexota bacterium]
MNAVFFLPNLSGGGAERVALTLLRHLDASQVHATLILLRKTGVYWDELPSNVSVIEMSQEGQRIRQGLKEFWKKANPVFENSDIFIGAEELDATYYAFGFAKLFNKPVIGWVHSPIESYLNKVPRYHRILSRIIYPQLQALVFPSSGAVQSMCSLVRKTNLPVRVISNPIDLETVCAKASEPLPADFHSIFSKSVVLGIGRLSAEKGYDVLIRAHALALQKGHDHNLVIVGEGNERGNLEALIRDYRLQSSAFLPGFVANPYTLLSHSTIFAHPARYEGFGMAVLEALACGIPVVAAESAGVSSILDGGKYGIEVPQGNEAKLAAELCRLLDDNELQQQLGRVGPSRAENYQVKKVAAAWENLLLDIVR